MQNQAHILVIDDNANMLETMRDILTEKGYRIATAQNLTEARNALIKNKFRLVLVDLKLPDGCGLELLKDIKQNKKDIPVIIFTAYGSLQTAISAMNDGAFGYLQKPLNLDELDAVIKKALHMQELKAENENLINKLKNLSLKDTHTGLYNYRYLMERLSAEFMRAKRYILSLSILMLDIDYFKSLNDVYGHQFGDLILKEFSSFLLKSCRRTDIVVRYGGEEFVILMPDTLKQGAMIFAERLLKALQAYTFDKKDKRIKLKVSIGVANYPEDGLESVNNLLDAANTALKKAKENGGNCVCGFQKMGFQELKKIVESQNEENVEQLKEKLSKMEGRTNQVLLEAIYAFAKTVEARDLYTGRHAEDMISLVTQMGKKLNLSDKEIDDIKHAAILHDLGKVGISDNILHKKEKLTKTEYEKIKKHPVIGAEIIRCIRFLKDVVPMVLYHHERYDGLGYVHGLKGEEIPLGARIIAVADVYQALISNRPYRKALSKEEALKIIQDDAGAKFDPKIVKVFIEIMRG
jgi:diguanylate cyclase (GGDEF)-like protein